MTIDALNVHKNQLRKVILDQFRLLCNCAQLRPPPPPAPHQPTLTLTPTLNQHLHLRQNVGLGEG